MANSPADFIQNTLQNDLSAFFKFSFRELSPGKAFLPNWHLELLADRLRDCLVSGSHRLIVNASPQTGKTTAVSVAFALWALAKNPALQITIIAGTKELSREIRSRIEALSGSKRFRALFPHLRLRPDRESMRSTYGGGIFFGVAGKTGLAKGSDIVILDTPQTAPQAQDRAERAASNAWLSTDLLPHLADKSDTVAIIVASRLHSFDLTHHFSRVCSPTTQVILPAVARQDERWRLRNGHILERPKLTPLHAARQDIEKLKAIMSVVGVHEFASQYQQDPSLRGSMENEDIGPVVPGETPVYGFNSGFLVVDYAYGLHEFFSETDMNIYTGLEGPPNDWEVSFYERQRNLIIKHFGEELGTSQVSPSG